MDVEIETCEVSNILVKWNVGIPRLYNSVQSKSFLVYGYNWNLTLATDTDPVQDDEEWSMNLHCLDNKYLSCFPLTVYIRHNGRYLMLSGNVINKKKTLIWSSRHSYFRKQYPGIQVVGSLLQFQFSFHSKITSKTHIKEDKSVETSDDYPCLENLSLNLSKVAEEGTDTDVQLKCGDISIGAHKLILGARSEVFRTMMQSDMVEGRERIVEIIDMEPKILKIFIRYIYTGILPELTVDTALPIYEAADKYQVEALKKRSSHFLVKNLSPENALGILAMADAHSDSDLKDQLVSYVIEEKIPSRKVEWLKFCDECPKLAVEVLNFFYDLPRVSL